MRVTTLVAKAKFEVLNHSRLLTDRMIAVSGRIGSGKSETATYLSERLGIPLIKSGVLLGSVMGSPPISEIGRSAFQARALSFIQSAEGPEKLAAAILQQANAFGSSRCIVDGIRNLATYERLKTKTQGSVALLFVQTPPDLAFDMYRAREAQVALTFSYRDFLKMYDAPVEAEITSLGRNASAYIYNYFGLEAFRRTLDAVVETFAGTH
jgi:adenylate kinase family enzyme